MINVGDLYVMIATVRFSGTNVRLQAGDVVIALGEGAAFVFFLDPRGQQFSVYRKHIDDMVKRIVP